MSLAIFDLDDTLIPGNSESAWCEFLIGKGVYRRQELDHAMERFSRDYRQGRLDIVESMRFVLEPLGRHDRHILEGWRREFMTETFEPIRLAKADKLLVEHRAKGDFLLIITAANSFVAEPIARALGVDDILATEPEIIDGRMTGRITGTPCFHAGKVERLEDWLADKKHGLDRCSFFTDSHNDLPLLERVSHPVAVDPDTRLKARADERGWPVISLREARAL